jgi:hypothetical protein
MDGTSGQKLPIRPENLTLPPVLLGFVVFDLSFSVLCFVDRCL